MGKYPTTYTLYAPHHLKENKPILSGLLSELEWLVFLLEDSRCVWQCGGIFEWCEYQIGVVTDIDFWKLGNRLFNALNQMLQLVGYGIWRHWFMQGY